MNEYQYVHLSRLKNDYESMGRLRGPIQWEPLNACNPAEGVYPTKYRVTYDNILAPTLAGNRRQHTIEINCSSASYPAQAAPIVTFVTPVLKHPHVFREGKVCIGGFPLEELLAGLCIRLAKFFHYDPMLINPKSIATREFYEWYEQNKQRLPLEETPIPYVLEKTTFKPKGIRTKDRASGLRVKERR